MHAPELTILLENLGFSKNEAKVYLALLELGEATPGKVSRKAGVKRPTTYVVLEQLLKKDYVVLGGESASPGTFRAVTPHKLLERQQHMVKSLSDALPKLLALNSIFQVSPTVSVYSGHTGIRKVWEDSLSSSTDICYWSDSQFSEIQYLEEQETVIQQDEKSFLATFVDRRIQKGLWVRGLVPYEANDVVIASSDLQRRQKEYLSLKKEGASKLRDFRFLPRAEFQMRNEVTVYEDKVVLLSYKDLFGVMFKSEMLADILRSMFTLAFNYAALIEGKIMKKSDRDFLNTKT